MEEEPVITGAEVIVAQSQVMESINKKGKHIVMPSVDFTVVSSQDGKKNRTTQKLVFIKPGVSEFYYII